MSKSIDRSLEWTDQSHVRMATQTSDGSLVNHTNECSGRTLLRSVMRTALPSSRPNCVHLTAHQKRGQKQHSQQGYLLCSLYSFNLSECTSVSASYLRTVGAVNVCMYTHVYDRLLAYQLDAYWSPPRQSSAPSFLGTFWIGTSWPASSAMRGPCNGRRQTHISTTWWYGIWATIYMSRVFLYAMQPSHLHTYIQYRYKHHTKYWIESQYHYQESHPVSHHLQAVPLIGESCSISLHVYL